MPTQNPRVSFMLSKEMLAMVEDFQHENRIKSTSKAIVKLLAAGLEEMEKERGRETVPPPDTLAQKIESLAQTLTPPQRAMLRDIVEQIADAAGISRSAPPTVHDMTPDEIRAEVDRQLAAEEADRKKGYGGGSTGFPSASGAGCG